MACVQDRGTIEKSLQRLLDIVLVVHAFRIGGNTFQPPHARGRGREIGSLQQSLRLPPRCRPPALAKVRV